MALNKPAWQDSTYLGYVASLAVDGNDNPDLHTGSCTHTATYTYPTWGVDLQVMAIIYSIEIMRRDFVSHGKYVLLYHAAILQLNHKSYKCFCFSIDICFSVDHFKHHLIYFAANRAYFLFDGGKMCFVSFNNIILYSQTSTCMIKS